MDKVGLVANEFPTAALIILALLAALILYRWQRSHPAFDLADLITGTNGKVSLKKMGVLASLVVSTWGFATLAQQGKMSEFYFIGYMGVWCGYRAYVETNKPKDPE